VSEVVSVIIPAYNTATYLGEAIDSVRAQSYDRVEIIVVDDGSTDDTAAVATRAGGAVRFLTQPHRGAPAARNHGVSASTGQYLAFLDADDLWEPEKLAAQLAAFAADPGLDIVFGHVVQFWSPELELPPEARSHPGVGVPMRGDHPGTMLVTRAVFDEIGPFCEDDSVGDFVDWYARALDRGHNTRMLESVVMRRRLHRSNSGRSGTASPEEYARTIRRMLERRRGRAG
jgi:glycosyltransferase involved in cell wall biosynthesis